MFNIVLKFNYTFACIMWKIIYILWLVLIFTKNQTVLSGFECKGGIIKRKNNIFPIIYSVLYVQIKLFLKIIVFYINI